MPKILALFVCACFMMTALVGVEATAPVNTEQVTATVEQAPADHLKLIFELKDRSSAAAAVDALVALKHTGVKYLFQRIMDRTIYEYGEGLVYVAAKDTNEAGIEIAQAYPVYLPSDESGKIDKSTKTLIPFSELKSFKPNRKARKGINRALSIIGLYLEDPVERLAASTYVGNKRLADALPILAELIKQEQDTKIKFVMQESISIITAADVNGDLGLEARVGAVVELGNMNSIRSLDLLKEISKETDLNPELHKQATLAIEDIESHQTITEWIQHAFSGLSAGSILLMISLGLAVTFGLMGVINMAHGEMLMIGAVTAWFCCAYVGPMLPASWFNWYFVLAIPLSFLMAAGVGILMEVSVVRFLYKRPLDSMLATIGVSYVLIQAVRLMIGDNLSMTVPTWFSGGWEIMQDVVLPYNRLFVIALTVCCVTAVACIFKYTRFGLMLRATVQNREVAAANGVNTRLVDMLTFGLGSGLAGIAGCALVLLTNVSPEMGTTYIVQSFLVTVVAGVGSLLGVIYSALGLGFLEKFIEPLQLMDTPIQLFDSTWAKVLVLIMVVIFIQRRPGGLFPERGRNADKADPTAGSHLAKVNKRGDLIGFGLLFGIGIVLVPAFYGMGWITPEFVSKLGYILTFAICAIGLDLMWGYTGVLSLCQAMFFAFGAYIMGLYLINHGPTDLEGIPTCLAYLMSDVSNRSSPWFLSMFEGFGGTIMLGVILPGLCAFLLGVIVFRSRVKGVYFAIMTQAITYGANLVMMKTNLKLGGANGLTNFETILGATIEHNADAHLFAQTKFWIYMVIITVLMAAIFIARRLANGGLGRVLIATRDDETRLRFSGYQVWAWKALIFGFAAALAAIGGMLYVPLKGIINPHQILPEASIMVVAWVAIGGRGTVWGAVLGAIVVSFLYDWITSYWPEGWKLVLGAMFIAVPLLLPGGLLSLGNKFKGLNKSKNDDALPSAPAPVVEGEVA